MKIGLLRPEDVGEAHALSVAEGWNQTESDWRRLIRLEPGGCFAAREEATLAGTVTVTTYGSALAWIGMMIVHPDHRRRGLGTALLETALAHAEARGIVTSGLDATPAGRPLYESLGFTAVADIERWQGVARAEATIEPAVSGPAFGSRGSVETRRALYALDQEAYGVDRSRLLERLIEESSGGALVAWSANPEPDGYVLARRGRTAIWLGPLVASTPAVAARLLDGSVARYAGEAVCIDRLRGGLLEAGMLAARGLEPQRDLTRMLRGAATEAAPRREIAASAGPEHG